MSYTRDRDSYTRGAGAIAAVDGLKSRSRRIREAQGRRKTIALDRARAMATRGGLGRISTEHEGIGAGGGTGAPPPRLPGALMRPVAPGSVMTPNYPGSRPVQPVMQYTPGARATSVLPTRAPTTGGMFGAGTMKPTRTTGFPIRLPPAGVSSGVVPITNLPLATPNVSGAGLVTGGAAASPAALDPVDTSSNYVPDDTQTDSTDDTTTDDTGATSTTPASSPAAAPMSTNKKVALAALGLGALWYLFGR